MQFRFLKMLNYHHWSHKKSVLLMQGARKDREICTIISVEEKMAYALFYQRETAMFGS